LVGVQELTFQTSRGPSSLQGGNTLGAEKGEHADAEDEDCEAVYTCRRLAVGMREEEGTGSGWAVVVVVVIVEREEKGHGEMLGRVTIYPSKQCHY